MPALSRLNGGGIPAYAGMTVMGARCASRPQYPLPAAFAASSPLVGKGDWALAPPLQREGV